MVDEKVYCYRERVRVGRGEKEERERGHEGNVFLKKHRWDTLLLCRSQLIV